MRSWERTRERERERENLTEFYSACKFQVRMHFESEKRKGKKTVRYRLILSSCRTLIIMTFSSVVRFILLLFSSSRLLLIYSLFSVSWKWRDLFIPLFFKRIIIIVVVRKCLSSLLLYSFFTCFLFHFIAHFFILLHCLLTFFSFLPFVLTGILSTPESTRGKKGMHDQEIVWRCTRTRVKEESGRDCFYFSTSWLIHHQESKRLNQRRKEIKRRQRQSSSLSSTIIEFEVDWEDDYEKHKTMLWKDMGNKLSFKQGIRWVLHVEQQQQEDDSKTRR